MTRLNLWQRMTGLWRRDLWPTLKLAAPIMVARMGVTMMFVVDSIIIGQASGIELAFFGQALAPQSVMMLICIGLMQGSMILSAQAFGAKDYAECGQIWRTALIAAAMVGAFMAVLSLFVEQFLNAIGTAQDLARAAGIVSWHFAWGMPGMLLFITSNYFLEAVKRPYFGMLIMGVANGVNLLADGILIGGWFGWTPSSSPAETAVITTSFVRWLAFALALAIILGLPGLRHYGITGPLTGIWPRLRKMLTLSAPIALLLGADQAAFSAVSLMAGQMGVVQASAQQLTTSLTGIIFLNIVGLAAATNIRVGHAVGAVDADEAGRASWAGVTLAVLLTAGAGAAFLAWPQGLARIYTADAAVLAVAAGAIMAASLMLVFDGTVTVANAALRGRGDTMRPALIHMVSLWVLGVPCAYGLGFGLDWGVAGLTLGLTVGMAVSCAIVLIRLRFMVRGPVRRV